MRRVTCVMTTMLTLLTACGSDADDQPVAASGSGEVTSEVFVGAECSGGFVAHDLDHVTTGGGDVVAVVDGTGAGVLVEDLDDDGWADIVLPNLSGETSVLWNDGDLAFTRDVLVTGRYRQAVTADVDHDGDRDLVLTTGVGFPLGLFGGDEPRTYERGEVGRIRWVAFVVAPGDLDGDGGIDLVTSTYNAELTANQDSRAMLGIDVGTILHRWWDQNETFRSEVLAESAQSLAIMIVDVDGDGRDDVLVGNDLGTPDKFFKNTDDGMVLTDAFVNTTLSTMSLDVGDLDNDGQADVVATDMRPMDDEPATVEAWAPVLPDIEAARVDDVQIPENVVQFAGDGFDNQARDLGVEATGWSWSGLFGDLDQDGLQDLYVVNGMASVGMFDHLPNAELVEENQAFRYDGDAFVSMPDWGLGDDAGGRGMAQADLDRDGDLDIVVNNLGEPSRLYENQICAGSSIVVDPIWDGVANRDALGATVIVRDGAREQLRLITGSRGYASTSPTEAHVGFGDDVASGDEVEVQITWPDGVAERYRLAAGERHTVVRTTPPTIDGEDGGDG